LLKHFNITVTGKVQGVFYRASTQTQAHKLGLNGFVRNEPNGDVFIEAEGEETKLQKLVDWCSIGPPNAIVDEVRVLDGEIKNFSGFSIKR
jgi:acylphosphatase